MTNAGKRLIQAAEEALEIAKGDAEATTYRVHTPLTIDVRGIRKGMKLTQAEFGARFGFGLARIRDWEQGRTRPDAANRAFLATIEAAPDVVMKALASHPDVGTP